MCWHYFKIFIGDFSMQSVLRPTVCNLLRHIGIGFSRKMNECYLKTHWLISRKKKKKPNVIILRIDLSIDISQLQGRYGN